MAVIIPNSTETTGGNPYASLDQAEPDSIDFEIIGHSGRSGVLSGCEVTSNNNVSDVAITSGDVVIDGRSYPLSSSPSFALSTQPVDARFDLIVARLSGGSVSLVHVDGDESATNPVYPTSRSVDGITYGVDFDTDVVLAAIYRDAGTVVGPEYVVDKRAMVTSTIFLQGSSLPASAPDGTTFFRYEATTGTGVVASGLYIRANGAWLSLTQDNEYSNVPIGMSMTWRGTANDMPSNWLVEDGSAVSRATYSALFAAIGTTYGAGNGSTTFNLPDSIGRFARGSTTGNQGNASGSDDVTLAEGNLPRHNHGMAHTHTHAHQHSNNHGHGGTASGLTVNSHSHGMSHSHSGTVSSVGNHEHYANKLGRPWDMDWDLAPTAELRAAAGWNHGNHSGDPAGQLLDGYFYTLGWPRAAGEIGRPSMSTPWTGNTTIGPIGGVWPDDPAGSHSHSVSINTSPKTSTDSATGGASGTVNVVSHTGSTTAQTSTTTSGLSTAFTDYAGEDVPSTQAFAIVPRYLDGVTVIKAL